MKKYLWKALLAGMKSEHGDCKWEVGVWKKYEGCLSMCGAGFHASPTIVAAMGYVRPEYICKVEVRGEHIDHEDKSCWSEMRVVEATEWTKEDSVSLAVYAAELVIDIYEKKYPDDKRPRAAIDAAKQWLKEKTPAAYAVAYAAAYAYAYASSAASYAAASASFSPTPALRLTSTEFANKVPLSTLEGSLGFDFWGLLPPSFRSCGGKGGNL